MEYLGDLDDTAALRRFAAMHVPGKKEKAMYGYDQGDKKYRNPQKGDAEKIPKSNKGYHTYEKNETVVEDTVMKPGPVLSAATHGKFRKGKKPKDVPSASAVADALASHWGGKAGGPRQRGEEFDGVEWGG